jgi:hypothetical protein
LNPTVILAIASLWVSESQLILFIIYNIQECR